MRLTEKGKNWRDDDRIMSKEFAPLIMAVAERCDGIGRDELIKTVTTLYKTFGGTSAAIEALRSGEVTIERMH